MCRGKRTETRRIFLMPLHLRVLCSPTFTSSENLLAKMECEILIIITAQVNHVDILLFLCLFLATATTISTNNMISRTATPPPPPAPTAVYRVSSPSSSLELPSTSEWDMRNHRTCLVQWYNMHNYLHMTSL